MTRLRWATFAAVASAALVGSTAATAQTPFVADLTGAEEVPRRSTPGYGTARLVLVGASLNYHLNVTNITNVVAAHIHLGPPGVNGPIVLTLFNTAPPGISWTRRNMTSTSTIQGSGTVLEGPLAGQSIFALITQMQAGNAYVNVHTDNGIPPADTGPGDFPGGEIRGQIRPGGLVIVPPPPPPPPPAPPPRR